MRRREFIAALGGAAAWPLAARGQQSRRPIIGFSGQSTPAIEGPRLTAFLKRLRELGWVEGQTVVIEYAWGEGDSERVGAIAAGRKDALALLYEKSAKKGGRKGDGSCVSCHCGLTREHLR